MNKINFKQMKTISIIFLLIFFGLNLAAQQYKYDDQNRLIEITYLNGQEVTYSYDKTGNRIAKSSNSIVSLEEITPNQAIRIYPNPESYELNIQFVYDEYDNVTVEFKSISGESILLEKLTELSENSTQTLNVLALPVGSYILQILSENKVVLSEKVIISDKL